MQNEQLYRERIKYVFKQWLHMQFTKITIKT